MKNTASSVGPGVRGEACGAGGCDVGTGPLVGLRVVELAEIGPAPHAAMVLADLGADVVRVDRPSPASTADAALPDPILRGRRRIVVDLKDPAGRADVLRLVERSDVLLEAPARRRRAPWGRSDDQRARNPG